MALHREVYNRCTTYPPLAALISDRCYPIRLPQAATIPAVTFSQISEDDYDYRAHGEATPRAVGRVTFDCWGETADDSIAVADALVNAWSGYQALPGIGWGQIVLRQDNYEEGMGRYRTIVDVHIEYEKSQEA